MNDVAGGTATTAETELYQAYIDWTESSYGVASNQVTYQLITGPSGNVTWGQDPYVADLQNAASTAADGGSIEAAAAPEALSAASDLGIAESAGEAIATSPAGEVCLTTVACAVAAGGVVAAVVIGSQIVKLWDDSGGAVVVTGNAGSDTAPTAMAKVWGEARGSCVTHAGVSYQPVKFWDPPDNAYDSGTPVPGGTWINESWRGSGWYSPSDSSDFWQGVPCGTAAPGGGWWFAIFKWPTNANSVGGWALVDQSMYADDVAQPSPSIPQGAQCTNGTGTTGYWWTPPLPGGPGSHSPWHRIWAQDNNAVAIGDNPNNGYNGTKCTEYASGVTMAQESFVLWQYGTKAHLGFPRTGTCTTSADVQCVTAAPKPAGSWCTTALCASNVFATGNYPNLRRFVDSAIGVIDPQTNQPYSMPGTAQIPASCTGADPATCKAALTSAGFTAAPSETTLSPGQADLTKPAGAVVTTTPAVGSYVDTSQVITLNENPNPLPIVVPTCAGSPSYSDCASQLDAVGLTTHEQITVSSAGADLSQAAGAVLSVNYGGQRVVPSADIRVATNPNPLPNPQPAPDGTEDNNDPCDLTGAQLADPATQGQTEFQPYIGNPADSSDPNNFQVSGGSPTFLLWGTTSPDTNWGVWGFRHIYAAHGFGPADVAATRQTLLAPVNGVVKSTAPGAIDRWVYRGEVYWGGSGRIPCRRVVVVERARIDEANQPSNQTQTGIWTSYGEDLRPSS